MAEGKDPWFVLENSDALAVLLLTENEGVAVLSRRQKDDGVDILAGLDDRTSPPTRLFVVQVKGTLSADPAEWMSSVKQLFRNGSQLYLPTCVFVANVRDNTVRYSWIAEPDAVPGRATLKFHQVPTLHEMNSDSVIEIVNRVKAYYEAMPKQLLPTG